MPIIKIPCEVEIDTDRGVIYAHSDKTKYVTFLRICSLTRPIPDPRKEDILLDITHKVGTSWKGRTQKKSAPVNAKSSPEKSPKM